MSCRSMILLEQADNSYLGIYCHHEGYVEHNGAILNSSYQDRNKVEELIAIGDISELGFNVSDKEANHCIAYGRDLGVKGIVNAIKYDSLEQLDDITTNWCEFNYVYSKDNKWKYFQTGELKEGLKDLAASVKTMQRENVFGGASK